MNFELRISRFCASLLYVYGIPKPSPLANSSILRTYLSASVYVHESFHPFFQTVRPNFPASFISAATIDIHWFLEPPGPYLTGVSLKASNCNPPITLSHLTNFYDFYFLFIL